MKSEIKKISTRIIEAFWLITLICAGCGLTNEVSKSSLLDVAIPKDSAVIIHASTFTAYKEFASSPRSVLYFYNEKGEIIESVYETEEVVGDFIVESPKGLCYFFKNHSILTNSTSAVDMSNASGTTVKNINFGPSMTEYIKELDLSYALLNIGKRAQDMPYINILRFVSQEETYDVVIPYYLDSVHYDAERKEFICMIAPVDINGIEDGGLLNYVVVNMDELTEKFVFREDVHHLVNDSRTSETESLNSSCMVQNRRLYNVMVVPENTENLHGKGSLVLSVYDLETDEYISGTILIKDYELGKYGGVLVGSDDFPIIEKCGKLYVFVSTNQVFIITDENRIEILDMPYKFKDKLPLSSPKYVDYIDPEDFTDSIVHVEDDGEIYIMSLFKDNYLRIHRLLDSGNYELVWEGAFISDLPEDMIINDFEILSYRD